MAEEIFKQKKNGVFIDIGAYDGLKDSNSYYFEKHLGWTGLCIEPTKYLFDQLKVIRKCTCINGAIWNKTGPANFMEVRMTDGSNHGWSGLLDTYDDRQKNELINVHAKTGKFVIKETEVSCYTFNDLCILYAINHVDYLSIDTEGSELDILKSIDFDHIHISIIGVENNFNEPHIRNFLQTKGFVFLKRLGVDDIYQNSAK